MSVSFRKCIIHVSDNCKLALKLNVPKGVMIIGGHSESQNMMETIIVEYFARTPGKFQKVGYSKIKYIVRISFRDFYSGIALLRDHFFTVEENIKSLGTLIR